VFGISRSQLTFMGGANVILDDWVPIWLITWARKYPQIHSDFCLRCPEQIRVLPPVSVIWFCSY